MSAVASTEQSSRTPAKGRTDDLRRGITLILLSSGLFASMNAGVKLMSGRLSPVEIAFFRQFFSIWPVAILLFRSGGLTNLRTSRPLGHLFRGLIGNSAMVVFFLSVGFLPLADATALSFSSPLFATALSVPLLKEAVGVHRWSAVGVGFVGVVVMTHPTGAWFTHGAGAGAMMGLLGGFMSALMMITIRQLSKTEAPVTIVSYFVIIGALIYGMATPFFWVRPTGFEWLVLGAIGLVGGISQLVMTNAYRHAPASVLAPFGYTAIVWSTAFGYLIWGDLPGTRVLVGAAIVIGSGLYIIYREARRQAQLRSEPLSAAG